MPAQDDIIHSQFEYNITRLSLKVRADKQDSILDN